MNGPDPDLVVVGGGAAGLVAAREARRRGARTLLVHDGPLGGDCTHTGCVPSKALLASADAGAEFAEAMTTVRNRIAAIASTEDAATLRSEGIDVLEGRAHLRPGGRIEVGPRTIHSPRIILATGGRPAVPPIPGLDATPHLTSETLFSLESRPGRLAVIGGGPVGVEMAQAFAALGTQVTVIENEPRLLPREEPEASAVVTARLGDRGVVIRTGTAIERVESGPGAPVRVRMTEPAGSEATAVADAVLVATGRAPVTAGLGLAGVGVELDGRGFVRTDDRMATSAPGVWAVGDVTGRMPFTHAAARMAIVAVADALSGRIAPGRPRFDPAAIPWVTFTDPEVARVGVTEAEAAMIGGRVAHLPFTELDRAIVHGETDGFVKLVAGPRRLLGNRGGGRILGATVVGPRAGEMIAEVALVMHLRAFAGRLAQATHAYPTWSLAIQQAAAQLVGTYGGRTARSARPQE